MLRRTIRIVIIAGAVCLVALAVLTRWFQLHVRLAWWGVDINSTGPLFIVWLAGPAEWEWMFGGRAFVETYWWPSSLRFHDVRALWVPWWMVGAGWISIAAPGWLFTRKKRAKVGAFPVESKSL